jgi:hypothetical protein
MTHKRKPTAYVKDLNAHRLARLDRWSARVFPMPFIGMALLFPGIIVAILSESAAVDAWGVWAFVIGLGITVLGVMAQMVIKLFQMIERAAQHVEQVMGDDDKPKNKKKKNAHE